MIRTALFSLLYLGMTHSANAQAMWEISDHWTCTLEYQMILRPPAPPEVTGASGSYEIDFAKGTVGSSFTDSTAPIIERYSYASDFGDQTVLVKNWGGSIFSVTYVEGAGGFVTSSISSSGDLGSERWNTASFCLPS